MKKVWIVWVIQQPGRVGKVFTRHECLTAAERAAKKENSIARRGGSPARFSVGMDWKRAGC